MFVDEFGKLTPVPSVQIIRQYIKKFKEADNGN
jgi:hypothetical protein